MWPFRRRRSSEADRAMLAATDVSHLRTMPGSDVVVGTLFTDPLAPPGDDVHELDAFYGATPEAAPERLVRDRFALVPAQIRRLRTQLLGCLDPGVHQRMWMAVDRLTRWSELETLIDRPLRTTDGAVLTLRRPEPEVFVLEWRYRDQRQESRLVRGEHW